MVVRDVEGRNRSEEGEKMRMKQQVVLDRKLSRASLVELGG